MEDLSPYKLKKVHSRKISVDTYAVDEDKILVEGNLDDERMVSTRTISGKKLEAGPVHNMTVRMLVGGIPARIISTEVLMDRTPMDECKNAAKVAKELEGLVIAPGFAVEVKKRTGGRKGCNHLVALFLSMGSAAIQGWAAARSSRNPGPEEAAMVVEFIKDTCLVWRSDGERYKTSLEEVRESLAARSGKKG